MTVELDERSSEGHSRFLICPGQWFRGRKVIAVDRDWRSGIVRVELAH